jgi:Arm DNA-binding domain
MWVSDGGGHMTRVRKRLTARTVETITKPGLHADGGGLYLHVTASGAKSWIYRWSRDKQSHDMGLGTAGKDDVTIAEARELAAGARRVVRDGDDPIAARKTKRLQAKLDAAKAMTFRQCAEAYIAAKRPNGETRSTPPNGPRRSRLMSTRCLASLPCRISISGSS